MDNFNTQPQNTDENINTTDAPIASETREQPITPKKQPKTVKLSTVIWVAVLICYTLSLTVLLLSGYGYIRFGGSSKNTDEAVDYERFKEIYDILKQHYVGELNESEMLLNALAAYTASAGDRYTAYMPKVYADSYINGSYGNQSGIGVRILESKTPAGILIQYVFPDSPAEKAGIKKGDIITAVDGFIITSDTYTEATNKITGEEGTTVNLTLLRNGQTKIISVVRGSFTISSVEYAMLETAPDIGYIRIDGVASNTAKEFEKAVKTLQGEGAKKFVFDVRDDGGGYLDVITEILDMLLPEGPIVRWVLADGTEKSNTSDAERIVDAPIAVLINGSTASAAELFAAALKDYKLAMLVGENTFGKGVMQTIFPLKNGDSLKVTTAYYYPPFGDNYDGVGVKPDIEVSLPDNELYYTVTEEEDTQLQAAIEALNNSLIQD